MNERVDMYRNTNPEPDTEPVWEGWFPKTTDDAVILTGDDNNITDQNLKQKIKEFEATITSMKETISSLEEALPLLKQRLIEETEYTAIEAPNTEDSYTRIQINKDGTISKGNSSDGIEYTYDELITKTQYDELDKKYEGLNTNVSDLEETVTQLNSNLSPIELETPFLNVDGIESFNLITYKSGNVVSFVLTFAVTKVFASSTYTPLASGFPIPHVSPRWTLTSDDGKDEIARLELSTSGVLRLVDCITGAGYYKSTLVYVIK